MSEQRLSGLPPESSLWLFGASRELREDEIPGIEAAVGEFLSTWASHRIPLQGTGAVLERRFVAVAVDPRQKDASGCSIDKLYQFIQALGKSMSIDFLDSSAVFWADDLNVVHRTSREEFRQLAASGSLSDRTPVYDLGVTTVADLANWRRPAGESWHRQLFPLSAAS